MRLEKLKPQVGKNMNTNKTNTKAFEYAHAEKLNTVSPTLSQLWSYWYSHDINKIDVHKLKTLIAPDTPQHIKQLLSDEHSFRQLPEYNTKGHHDSCFDLFFAPYMNFLHEKAGIATPFHNFNKVKTNKPNVSPIQKAVNQAKKAYNAKSPIAQIVNKPSWVNEAIAFKPTFQAKTVSPNKAKGKK